MTRVRVVCEGYLRKAEGVVLEAHSTATLVQGDSFNILVDTSSPAYRPRLLDGLRSAGIDPEEVDIVVNTHLHGDHCGNNELFPRAVVMARAEEQPGAGSETVTADKELRPGVRLVHAPGHTQGSMAVLVEAEDGRWAIAGDAIPTRDNYDKWLPPGIRYDDGLALESMRRIVEQADIIVPGHGAPFRVTRPVKR